MNFKVDNSVNGGPINLVFCSDNKYFPALYCAIGSVLQTSSSSIFKIYVIDGGLDELSKKKIYSLLKSKSPQSQIIYLVPDESKIQKLVRRKEMTAIAYARLLIPEIVPESRVLYLDSDTLTFSDVAELWSDPLLMGEMLCAVADTETLCLADDSKKACEILGVPTGRKYFNSGVLLMNNDLLKADGFSLQCIEFQIKYGHICRFHDQSPINFIYSDRIREISLKWNTPVWLLDSKPWTKPSSIMHYTNERPWLRDSGKSASYFFRKYAESIGLSIETGSKTFQDGRLQLLIKHFAAPMRAVVFSVLGIYYGLSSNHERQSSYLRSSAYWAKYFFNLPYSVILNRKNRSLINSYFSLLASEFKNIHLS